MIRPPTAKICLLSPSVWHVLCRFWKKKNSALSGTECLVIHLSYFLIYLWVIFVHMPTRIVSSQKGLRNGIVFTKTKTRVNENIVFVTKLFLKYQLAVDMWPTWRGRRHCYDHWLIRAAFLEWGCFPVSVNEYCKQCCGKKFSHKKCLYLQCQVEGVWFNYMLFPFKYIWNLCSWLIFNNNLASDESLKGGLGVYV